MTDLRDDFGAPAAVTCSFRFKERTSGGETRWVAESSHSHKSWKVDVVMAGDHNVIASDMGHTES